MSNFTSPLVVRVVVADKKPFVLEEDFTYDIGYEGSEKTIRVPKGFRTDFASVPFGFRWLVPVVGKLGKAAVLHDFLYSVGGGSQVARLYAVSDFRKLRKMADDTFFEAMTVLKVNKIHKYAAWLGVRAFGWLVWRKRWQ